MSQSVRFLVTYSPPESSDKHTFHTVHLTGSPASLGAWSKESALKLERSGLDIWNLTVDVLSLEDSSQYRLFVKEHNGVETNQAGATVDTNASVIVESPSIEIDPETSESGEKVVKYTLSQCTDAEKKVCD